MKREDLNERLSKISTMWTVLRQAQAGTPGTAAQQLLMQRYGGAVYRYLLGALRDPAAAEDLTQEFALALVRGDFRLADPARGRFRDYVKTVLFHLVSKYRKREQRQLRPLPPDSPELSALAAPPDDPDRAFRESWSQELLARAWAALQEVQPVFWAVLRLTTEHEKLSSQQMAQQLSRQLGKPLTADAVRQARHRARQLFADLLLEEVAHSVEPPTLENVEQELKELSLLEYCRSALERKARGKGGA
jgi:RNA polymerase sigma-70 factor (ECF subfamily)